jgi:hypothetical protein
MWGKVLKTLYNEKTEVESLPAIPDQAWQKWPYAQEVGVLYLDLWCKCTI